MRYLIQNEVIKDLEIAEGFKLIDLDDVKKNMYYISEDGKIYSTFLNDFLKPRHDKNEYLELGLSTGQSKKRKLWKVHQLVAKVYLGNPPEYMKDPTVDHINGNIFDNNYRNLRWMERGINSSIRHNKGVGEQNHEAKLTEEQVIEICEVLIQNEKSLKEIADLYGVDKSTISNIKRKKSWTHLTKCYNFNIKKQKNKQENLVQREEIYNLLKNGNQPKEIIKIGYPSSVVWRCKKKLEIAKEVV